MALDSKDSSQPADGTPAVAAGAESQDDFGAEFERIVAQQDAGPQGAKAPVAEIPEAKPETPPASGEKSEQPTKTETAQPAQGPAAKPAASSAKNADAVVDWSEASPEHREAYESLAQKTTRYQGQVSSLSRKLNEQKSRPSHTPAADASPDAAASSGKPSAAKTERSEAIKKMVADYPEFAPLVDTVADVERANAELKKSQHELEASRQEAWLDEQDAKLTERHADYLALTQGEKGNRLAAWISQQPQWLQDIAIKNAHGIVDVDGADQVLTRFKASLGIGTGEGVADRKPDPPSNPQAARRAAQLEGSETVRSRGGAAGQGPADDFGSAFAYFAQRQDAEAKTPARR